MGESFPLIVIRWVPGDEHHAGHCYAEVDRRQNALFMDVAHYLRTVLAPALERQFGKAMDEELSVLLDVPREPNGWELTRDDADYET